MPPKVAANANALTQPKFELGITGIIHNVFQGDKTTKQKKEKYEFLCSLCTLGKISKKKKNISMEFSPHLYDTINS